MILIAIRDPRLQASYVGNPTEYLDELREQVIAGIKNPDRPIDVVYGHAKVAAHIGALRLAGTYIGEWMISGGSDESRYEFRLTARLAANAAGLVVGDATENERCRSMAEPAQESRQPVLSRRIDAHRISVH
jgi:hypothetical protein